MRNQAQSMKTIMRMTGILGFLIFALAQQVPCQEVRTIFLVRHAEKVSEAYDSLLSEQGHRRAECLANSLADAHIEQIFTSDLQRTQQTAAPLAEKVNVKPIAIPLSAPER